MPKLGLAKPLLFMGVDPGASGSASVILPTGSIVTGLEQWYIKFAKVTEHDISEWMIDLLSRYQIKAALEKVWCVQKSGRSAAFNFGKSYGFLQGLLTGLRIEYENPIPRKWQSDMGCLSKGDKNITKAKAQRKWPTFASQITHANADSLLLADWVRRQ